MGAGVRALPSGPLAPAPAPRMPAMMDDAAAIPDSDLITLEQLLAMAPQGAGVGADDGLYVHDENIAEYMDDAELDRLGQDILELIEADIRSRDPWIERFKRGLEIIGLKDFVWGKDAGPFEGASNAIHPMLAEAVVQSQARFMEEVFPAAGPVKATVMGIETPQKRDSADRVESHMNWQLTVDDPVYFMETQKLSMYLPIFGTAYRKAYHDYVADKNVLRYIIGEDVILPYSARNLSASPRITHRFPITKDEYEAGRAAGAYRDVDLQEENEVQPDAVKEQLDEVDGKQPEEGDKDVSWNFYETDITWAIAADPEVGSSGKPLPYTITLEAETGKVVAIRRCWKESDEKKLRRTRYAEYWYLPGLGCYGFGLIHMIGSLAEAGTDALRALLDSATWANLQGGFKAKDAAVKAGEMHVTPGVWKDVDMTSDELAKAFHTLPVKEPSEALFKLLDFLTAQAQRFAGTTELMVGEGPAKGAPVGTTVAMIEQGQKVYSGVHKRAHFAAGIEFRMLFELNAEYIPAEGYAYQVPGDDLAVYQQDYDDKTVGTIPVSDPNIFSQTQRIALAQAVYQLFQDNRDAFRRTEVLRSLLKAFKHPEIDTVLIDFDNLPDMDPISENIAMATQRPVKAKEGQNHDAHIAVHMGFLQHPQYGGLPQAQKVLEAPMMAHIAEHLALKYADTMRQMGIPLGQMDLSGQNGAPLPEPQNGAQNDQIAQMGAQAVGKFLQTSGLTTTPPGQGNDQAGADAHNVAVAKEFSLIATAIAALVKSGVTFQQAEAQVAQALQQGFNNPGAPPAAANNAGPAAVAA
jgi:chaperonin GroES